jgi:hypothetical protein
MRCSKCKMRDKCLSFKKHNDSNDIKLDIEIPFEYEMVDKEKTLLYII